VRYLAAKHKSSVLEPADLRTRANAGKWMDWQLTVAGPAIFECFWGLIRTPPEQRNHAAIEESRKKTTAAVAMMDAQLAKTAYLAGDAFSYGDIPVGIIAYRFRQLVPDRPPLKNFERWYAAIAGRQAFKDHIAAVPLT
jgi:glutathione S-transferase